jgi:sugar/nucleoside kinase (ribokinase family)
LFVGRKSENMLVTCAGILVVDIIAANLPKVSEPGELTYTPSGIEVHMGGHSGNVSVDLRKLGLKEGEVSVVAAVGQDVFGEFLRNVFETHGIVTHLQRVSHVGTSKNMALIVAGEDRRFHVDIGANWHLSPEHVLAVLEKEKPVIFYVGGVGFTGNFDEELAKVFERAKQLGCLIFVDPVEPYKRGWDFLISPLKWTDVFHCNRDEAQSITGKSDPREAAKVLTIMGANLAIISMGKEGLIAKNQNTLIEVPAFKVSVIDPTGAGDALCAGVLRGLLRKMMSGKRELTDLSTGELVQILLEGSAAGAACVTKVGTTTAVTESHVKQILEEQASLLLKTRVKVHSLS